MVNESDDIADTEVVGRIIGPDKDFEASDEHGVNVGEGAVTIRNRVVRRLFQATLQCPNFLEENSVKEVSVRHSTGGHY